MLLPLHLFAAVFQTSDKRIISYEDTSVGKPLVLIHAFPTDQRLWNEQREGLKKYFRVITLDLWGFGKSSAVNGDALTMGDYADEVKQLLDHLNVSKAIVGGESMGGYIALAFAKKYPEIMNGLILADTQATSDTEEAKKKREITAQDILKNGTTSFISGFMLKALSPSANEDTKNQLQNILLSQSREAMASALRGMAMREDQSKFLAQFAQPVLIITGEQDVLISPEQSQRMHALAKNSKLVTIENAGHLANLENASQWDEAVIKMFSETN